MRKNTSEADAKFRQWMRTNLDRAAVHFGVTVNSEPAFGWVDRSIGAHASKAGESYWLRVVSEDKKWIGGDFWTGNLDANAIAGISKPRVLDMFEWDEWRQQRAELMTLVPGTPCSPTDVLREEIMLPDAWWFELRQTVDVVKATSTTRVNVEAEKVARRVNAAGGRVALGGYQQETVHGDMHWANLLAPFGLLDWESWGRGPAGTDAATLLAFSLLTPATAARVRTTFADVLDTPSGKIAQLNVAGRLMTRIKKGDLPDLLAPLRHHCEQVVRSQP
jgi:hypothetical protein